jgi:MFS family permease
MPLALVSAFAAFVVLPATRPETSDTLTGQIGAAWKVVRQPLVFASIGFGFVLFVLVFGLFLTTMPVHLHDEFGLGPATRGFIVAAPAAGSTLAALRVGKMRARFGGRRLVTAATAVFAITFFVVGVSPWLWLLVAGTLVYGLAEGSSIPTVQDFVTGSAPDESRGAVVAVFVSSVRAGQTVGPLMAGAAMAVFGTSTTFLIAAAIAAVLLAVELVYRPEAVPTASTLAP